MKSKLGKLSRRGGRPSKEEASLIEDKILDAAAALFFSEGYGTTSIEEIARQAHISKRTFYVRYSDKAAIFRAVLHRLINRMRTPANSADRLFAGDDIKEILHRIAPIFLRATLTPEALALHRILVSEALRFPELVMIMNEQGARQEAIRRIAELLQKEADAKQRKLRDAHFAAEQFLQMLTTAPQRRHLGLGVPMTTAEIDAWASATVDLFLQGCWS